MQQFLRETVFVFKPTQGRLCWPVLLRIMDKINRGAKFAPIHVADHLIINGHHRFVCYSYLNLPVETTTWRTSAANKAQSWQDVVVDVTDWDKPEDVELHENTCFPNAFAG